jgi:hypothetical protein
MRLPVLAAFALAGCATTPAYEPAAGAPQASVTLQREGFKVMVLEFFSNGANCTDKRVLPGGQDFWDGKPVRIEAGREVAFGMATIVDTTISALVAVNTTCSTQIVSFTPEANVNYRIKYYANLADKICRTALARVGADGREQVEPTARWRQPLPLQGDAPRCAS